MEYMERRKENKKGKRGFGLCFCFLGSRSPLLFPSASLCSTLHCFAGIHTCISCIFYPGPRAQSRLGAGAGAGETALHCISMKHLWKLEAGHGRLGHDMIDMIRELLGLLLLCTAI